MILIKLGIVTSFILRTAKTRISNSSLSIDDFPKRILFSISLKFLLRSSTLISFKLFDSKKQPSLISFKFEGIVKLLIEVDENEYLSII